MALSLLGWFNGITSFIILVFFVLFGLYCLYQSYRTKAKLLKFFGLAILLEGFAFIFLNVEFFSILFSILPLNFPDNLYLHVLLAWSWHAPAAFFILYIGVWFLLPNYKKYLISSILIFGSIFLLFLLFDPEGSLTLEPPEVLGTNLYNGYLTVGSIPFIVESAFFVLGFSLNGFGLLYKASKSEGIIRRKFILISIGFMTNFSFVLWDSLTTPGLSIAFIRVGILTSAIIIYFGLREEPENKLKLEKEIKVEGDLFRISNIRSGEITEEEVSISKEKKICLVCKGKLARELYMCPECSTFYCLKCISKLTDLENACWVCETPFDETKPIKLHDNEKEKKEVKNSKIKKE
ncbi:MAG: hypothetical protein ACFFA3_08070 [Promethearchaeota archaeon]